MSDGCSPPGVASPCTSVCTIEPASGLCAGCLRTLDEIATWGALDDGAKREVWKQLPDRRRALADARGTS